LKVIIIGAGEVGFHLANRFAHENKDVVVIDKDPEALSRVSDNIDVQVILGSGASPVLLKEAGIKETEILLAVTNSDEVNLVACMAADIISPTTRKLARIRHADFDDYHRALKEEAPHIDTVINPEIEVVKSIERLMSVPGAVDVGEFADGNFKFIGIRLEKSASLCGASLIDIAKETGGERPLIAAIVRDDELIIPRGKDRLLVDDLVYFISRADNHLETLALFGKKGEPVKRVLVVGGGRIGMRFARRMEETGIQVKIIEKNSDRCLALAEELNKCVVLHGDGSDQNLLLEENIQGMDAVLTLTDDEETNILTSLLAKRLGAAKTITRISRFSYFPLMASIGIEQVVSPRLSAINTILQYVRQGKVISARAIKGETAEVIEAEALETSDIVGKPIKKIRFPKDTLIIGIMHGKEIIIPSGESVVYPGDRIIIFAHRNAIPKVEKMLAVKLEFF
jgi:trk system potassium uptake protein TrkA